MAILVTSAVHVARFANALYGVKIGSVTNAAVMEDISVVGLTTAVNSYYTSSFGSLTNAAVATSILGNLGLTGNAAAQAYVEAQLNAAGTAKGAAVLTMLNAFSNMTADATFGAAATAWNDKIVAARAYTVSNTADVTTDYSAPVTGQTFTLTTGVDGTYSGTNFTGGAENDVFNANDIAGTASWSAMDKIDGGAGNNTFNATSASAIAIPSGSTVVNMATVNLASASTVNVNASTFTGLATLNVTGAGALTLKAGAAVNIVATDALQAAGAIGITGAKDVTLTTTSTDGAAGIVAMGSVSIGGATTDAPAGAVSATVTNNYGYSGSTIGDITVTGGVGVTVNSTVNAKLAVAVQATPTGANEAPVITVAPTSGAVVINSNTNVAAAGAIGTVNGAAIAVTGGSTVNVTQTASILSTATAVSTVAQGAVSVTGDATTTAVTVTQTAAATGVVAKTLVVGAAGTVGVDAVTASPGVAGVTLVTAVNKVTAVAASAATKTVTAGGVAILDAANGSSTVANTISSVSLTNYGDSTISSTALNTLSLSGTGGTLQITEGGSAATVLANKTLTLNLGSGTKGVISDASHQFSTVNAVLSASATLGGVTDTALRTLNISGTGVLTLSATNAALTAMTVAGAAGFSGTLVGSSITSFTGASTTAANTVTFSPATVTYTGGEGVDTVTVTANATKAVTGGGGANVLVMEASVTPTAAGMKAFVSGFQTLSTPSTSGTINMALMPADITAISSTGASGGVTFTNVADGTSLALTAAHASGTTSYTLAGTGGAAKSVTVTLGSATSDTVGFGTVALLDINGNGVGTVSLVSNGVDITAGTSTVNNNTVALTDTGISQLNVSGTQGLLISAYTGTVTALTVNNTNTGTYGLNLANIIDASLDTLTFTGSGATTVGALTDGSIANLTITNSGTGRVSIGQIYESTSLTQDTTYLTNLTLVGNVVLGAGGLPYDGSVSPVQIHTSTAAVTVSGATDHAGVALRFTGVNSNATTVTLGDGNNYVRTTETTGGGNITTGSGMDWVQQGSLSAATKSSLVSTGAGMDTIVTGVGFSSTVVTKAAGGDGADYIQVQSIGGTTYVAADGTAGKYGSVVWTGSQTTGSTVTAGSWTGTLYSESSDTITSSGVIQPTFVTLMSGSLVNAAGAGKIFADANIVAPMYGQGAVLVASTAKDVFLFQTENTAMSDTTIKGISAGGSIVQNFKIGTDVIAVTNYQGSGDNLFVGTAAAVTAINAVTASEALLASTSGWSWAFDAGSTTAGVLSYVGAIGSSLATNANMTIHLVGVQGSIVSADSFFYQG